METTTQYKNGTHLRLVEVAQEPQRLEEAARWFQDKWHVPLDAYLESMNDSLTAKTCVPRWYLVLDGERIVAGGGIIENDFHERKDLKPNFCALYVEPEYRNQGLARWLLDRGRSDAGKSGLRRLYLITDHEDFYEKCGWRLSTMVQCDSGEVSRLYEADTTVLETERLLLRPWWASDAPALYRYAQDPQVGPAAGWPVHTSVENSLRILSSVLSEPETFAVVRKDTGEAVGSIGMMVGQQSNLGIPDSQGEIGYWVGRPYWGQGLIPEAVRAIQRYGFETLGLDTIWCAYFDGNDKSRRVQEKCGFTYHHTNENQPWPLMNTSYTEHVTVLTKADWEKK